jgi:hypothetical protein
MDERLILTVWVVHRHIILERILYSWIFLGIMLDILPTAVQWKEHIPIVNQYAATFEVVRLPEFDLQTRTSAKREKQKWYQLYLQVYPTKLSRSKKYQLRQYILNQIIRTVSV